MRYQRTAGLMLAVVVAAGLAAGAGAQTPASYVRVFVDTQPVYFDVPPEIFSGRVLVPLRGVFERLGATVAWDDATQTVLAQRGETSVSLRVGATQAMINGQPTYMDVPAMLVSGRTMVPLRFVSQALGAQVNWEPATTTVAITSQAALGVPPVQLPSQQTYPPVTPAPVTSFSGTVLAVNPAGQMTVQAGASAVTYQVTPATTISLTNVTTGAGGSASLQMIRPGDAVTVTADQNGVAQSIQATYAEASGIIGSVSPGILSLQNGVSYRVNPAVQVAGGGTVSQAALAPGETVVLRLNPMTNEVWGVVIRQGALPPVGPVSVSPSGRPLVSGDVLTVATTGPAGGTATFTIGGFRSNLPMYEQAGRPGTYVGTYTVQPGDFVQGAPIVVRISAGGQLQTANAPTTVSLGGAASVPPYGVPAPVITSPPNGATVGIPLPVTGQAAPGTRVRVQANYSGTVLLFNVNGTLGTQTVTADQFGNWTAVFSQEPTVRGGVALAITATAVDANGNSISQSSNVTATLQ